MWRSSCRFGQCQTQLVPHIQLESCAYGRASTRAVNSFSNWTLTGLDDRQTQGVSQTLQFDEKRAAELVALIRRVFPDIG